LNACGDVALTCWRDIPRHFPSIRLDAMVVMPNHVHGVLWIVDELNGDAIVTATPATPATPATVVGAQHAAPLQLQPTPRPMPRYPGVTSGSLNTHRDRRDTSQWTSPQVWSRNCAR
jgi:hypothetical protein